MTRSLDPLAWPSSDVVRERGRWCGPDHGGPASVAHPTGPSCSGWFGGGVQWPALLAASGEPRRRDAHHFCVIPDDHSDRCFGFVGPIRRGVSRLARVDRTALTFLNANLQMGSYPYVLIQIGLIYFFSYFWTTVVFSPEEMSEQLRDHGSFIPGLRPGAHCEYLETVVERITYVGAGFLAIIALIPTVVASQMGVPMLVSQFLGGTGLLIVVSVGLDLVQRIEAALLMKTRPDSSIPAREGGQLASVPDAAECLRA